MQTARARTETGEGEERNPTDPFLTAACYDYMDTSGVALHVQVSQGRQNKLRASISVYILSYYRNMELYSISEMYSP